MIRPKLLLFFGLALLLVGLVQIRDVSVSAAAAGTGTAVISDGQALSDSITYTMVGVTVPASGVAYEGWLVSNDDSTNLSTGVITVGSDGSISHTYTSPTGANLIELYHAVIITEEPVPDTDAGSSGVVLFSHQIPANGLTHIRHLLVDATEPEANTSGAITNLKSQLDVGIARANLAKDSTTLADVKNYLEHVVNVVEGSGGTNFGDLDGDGVTENPGDGYGTSPHAKNVQSHATLAASAAASDTVIVASAGLVETAGKNTETWSNAARDAAIKGLAATTVDAAKVFVGPGADTVISNLDAARNGFDADADGTVELITGEAGAKQAYVEGQKTATYTLAIGPLPTAAVVAAATPVPAPAATPVPAPAATPVPAPVPAPETVYVNLGGLPNVGDSSVTWLAQLALILGLTLVLAGGTLLYAGRRSRLKA